MSKSAKRRGLFRNAVIQLPLGLLGQENDCLTEEGKKLSAYIGSQQYRDVLAGNNHE